MRKDGGSGASGFAVLFFCRHRRRTICPRSAQKSEKRSRRLEDSLPSNAGVPEFEKRVVWGARHHQPRVVGAGIPRSPGRKRGRGSRSSRHCRSCARPGSHFEHPLDLLIRAPHGTRIPFPERPADRFSPCYGVGAGSDAGGDSASAGDGATGGNLNQNSSVSTEMGKNIRNPTPDAL